jgi:hypothetical protein
MDTATRRSRLFSLDSLRGYNESHATKAQNESLDDSSDVSFEDLTNSTSNIRSVREVGVQVDLGLTYPQLVAQALRHLAATTTATAASYANFEAALLEPEPEPLSSINAREEIQGVTQEEEMAQQSDGSSSSSSSSRVSSSTVYEDIEDVVAYFDEAENDDENDIDELAAATVPPPLPPRRTANQQRQRPDTAAEMDETPSPLTANNGRRKDLSVHLGLGGRDDGEDVQAAQRIALENIRQRSQSRKDLNRFLGLSEGGGQPSPSSPTSAVVKRRRRLLVKGGSSRHSFIESLLLGRVLRRGASTKDGSIRCGSEEPTAYRELINSPGGQSCAATSPTTLSVGDVGSSNLNLRQRKLEHFFGTPLGPEVVLLDSGTESAAIVADSKSRSASFSSTISSASSASSSSSVTSSSDPFSSSSSVSVSSTSSSVARLLQPAARFHSSLSSLRRPRMAVAGATATTRRGSVQLLRYSAASSSGGPGRASESDHHNVSGEEDISEFIERGMPVIPFSSPGDWSSAATVAENRSISAAAGESVAPETVQGPLDRVGHSLDALIDFARHELRRSRERRRTDSCSGSVAAVDSGERLEAANESLYMEMRAQTVPQHDAAVCDQFIHQSREQQAKKQQEQLPRPCSEQLGRREQEQLTHLRSEQLGWKVQEQLIHPCSVQLERKGQEQLIKSPCSEQLERRGQEQLIKQVNQLDYMDMSLVRKVLAVQDS